MTSVMVTIHNRTTGKERTFTVEDPDPEYVRRRFAEWFPDVLDWVMVEDEPGLDISDVPIALWEDLTDAAA